MAYQKTLLHDWRSKLTEEELKVVKGIEKEQRALRRSLAKLAVKLAPLRNRAINRCRYVPKAKAQEPGDADQSRQGG